MESLTTVDKAVDVLFALHTEARALGVTALARSLNLPKSSTHRLLATLTQRGLVERTEGGRYRTGIGLVALGLGALDREPLCVAARGLLEQEARALGETVFLVAARGGRLVVLDKAEGTGFLRAAPQVGAVVPVHATAVGKLYLAFSPDQVEKGDGPPEKFTPNTLHGTRALARAAAAARIDGYAENRNEWIDGLSVVAAPIFARGSLRGAVAVASSSPRMLEIGGEATRRAVLAGLRIGRALEGSPELAS